MSRLRRFLHLERARADETPEPARGTSGSRFGDIAAPPAEPAGEPDPFAPPPERETRLDLADRDEPAELRAERERRTRERAAEIEEMADERRRVRQGPPPGPVERVLGWIVRVFR